MAKPDNRADNVEHLQQHVQNTLENLNEAKSYLNAHADEIDPSEKANIEQKNERRRDSIDSFREEIKDEASSQK